MCEWKAKSQYSFIISWIFYRKFPIQKLVNRDLFITKLHKLYEVIKICLFIFIEVNDRVWEFHTGNLIS